MSKFKVGDNARIIKNKPHDSADYIGITGKIDKVINDERYSIDSEQENYWYPDEIELIHPRTSIDTIPVTPRSIMNPIVIDVLEDIKQLFTYKNGNYGSDDDAMFNFRTAAVNVLGDDSAENMYKVLMIYIEKHMAALRKNGLDDPEFVERFKDVIVYSFISITMKKRMEENK